MFIPARILTFLGFIINSEEMTVRLTPEKAQRLREECTELLNTPKPTIRAVAKVIGLMVSSAPAVELCMLFYRTIENEKVDALKLNFGDFDAQMVLSASAKLDLHWWIDNIQLSEKKISPPNPDIVLTTDASKQGWGAVRDHHTTGGRWSPVLAELHINELELKAVLFALRSLCNDVSNKHIRIMSDNTTTVCYINNMGGSKSRACNDIARRIWKLALERNNFLSSAHLPLKQNIVADRESRVFNDRTEWMLHQGFFQKLSQLWGPFEVDLFASRLNKQISTYVSWKPDPGATAVDAFSIVWIRKPFYAFPPFALIHRCLQKIIVDEAEGVIIVPMWPTQTYYPRIMSMLIQPPRLLLKKENLLRLPHSDTSHPLWQKMQLMACLVSGKASKQQEFQKKLEVSLQSWRKSTRNQYGVHYRKWTTFCCERKIDPHDISVNNVLKFLTFLFESGLGYSSINTARSAISSLDCDSTCPVGNHPLICRFMRGSTFQGQHSLVTVPFGMLKLSWTFFDSGKGMLNSHSKNCH